MPLTERPERTGIFLYMFHQTSLAGYIVEWLMRHHQTYLETYTVVFLTWCTLNLDIITDLPWGINCGCVPGCVFCIAVWTPAWGIIWFCPGPVIKSNLNIIFEIFLQILYVPILVLFYFIKCLWLWTGMLLSLGIENEARDFGHFTGKSHNSFNRFIKYAKEVLLSSLPFLQSLKFVASLDLNLKCSSKFSLVKCWM